MKSLVDVNLIKALGLDKLPPEEQEKLLLQIGDVIYESIIGRAIKALNVKDKIELEHMLADNPSFETIGEFMYAKIPNIDKIAEEEIGSFKKIALDTFRTAVAA